VPTSRQVLEYWTGSDWRTLHGHVGETGARGPRGLPGQSIRGPAGPAGRDGLDSTTPGPEGPAGPEGRQGEPGVAGSRWWSGQGDPPPELGQPHDWYLNEGVPGDRWWTGGRGDVWERTETMGWVWRLNIRGPAGPAGASGGGGAGLLGPLDGGQPDTVSWSEISLGPPSP
jgi:hypothetical protein